MRIKAVKPGAPCRPLISSFGMMPAMSSCVAPACAAKCGGAAGANGLYRHDGERGESAAILLAFAWWYNENALYEKASTGVADIVAKTPPSARHLQRVSLHGQAIAALSSGARPRQHGDVHHLGARNVYIMRNVARLFARIYAGLASPGQYREA